MNLNINTAKKLKDNYKIIKNEGDYTYFKNNEYTLKLKTNNYTSFLDPRNNAYLFKITINANELLNSIKHLEYTMIKTEDNSLKKFSGLLFNVQDQNIDIIGSDSYQLAISKLKLKENEFSF